MKKWKNEFFCVGWMEDLACNQCHLEGGSSACPRLFLYVTIDNNEHIYASDRQKSRLACDFCCIAGGYCNPLLFSPLSLLLSSPLVLLSLSLLSVLASSFYWFSLSCVYYFPLILLFPILYKWQLWNSSKIFRLQQTISLVRLTHKTNEDKTM